MQHQQQQQQQQEQQQKHSLESEHGLGSFLQLLLIEAANDGFISEISNPVGHWMSG